MEFTWDVKGNLMTISRSRKGAKRVQRSPEADVRAKAKRSKVSSEVKREVEKTIKRFNR